MPKRIPCMRCKQLIWFDWERKFDDLGYREGSNKPNIPLECGDDGEFLAKRHDCPESEYNRMGRQQSETTTVPKEAPRTTTVMEAKIDSIGTRVENIESMLNKLIVHLMGMDMKEKGVGIVDEDDRPNPMERE